MASPLARALAARARLQGLSAPAATPTIEELDDEIDPITLLKQRPVDEQGLPAVVPGPRKPSLSILSPQALLTEFPGFDETKYEDRPENVRVTNAILRHVVRQESRGSHFQLDGSVTISKAGALGLMQIMPATAALLGIDPRDPVQNVEGGTRLLQELLDKYGNWPDALMAYNRGEPKFLEWVRHGRDPVPVRDGGTLPNETFDYVAAIMPGIETALAAEALPLTSSPVPPKRGITKGPLGRALDARDRPADPLLTLLAAEGTNPDQNVKDLALAKKLGLPPESAEPDIQEVDAMRAAELRITVEELQKVNPITAKFMTVKRNALAGRDSLPELSLIEKIPKKWRQGQLLTIRGRVGTALRLAFDGEEMDPAIMKGLVKIERELADLRDQLGEAGETMTKEEFEGAVGPSQPIDFDDILEFFPGMIGATAEVLGQMSESLFTEEILATIGAGALVGAGGGAVIGGPPGAIGGALTVGGATLLSAVAVTSYVTEGGNAFVDMLGMGIEPDLAVLGSVMVGVVNAGLEVGGLRFIATPFVLAAKKAVRRGMSEAMQSPVVQKAFVKWLKVFARTTATEVVVENFQEISNIIMENFGKFYSEVDLELDTPEQIADRLAQITVKTLQAMILLGAGTATVSVAIDKVVAKDGRRANAAHRMGENLKELTQAMKASPMTERAPEQAGEHVAAVMKPVGVETALVNAEELAKVLDDNLEEPGLLDALGIDQAQLDEASARGGDVTIDMANYASVIMTGLLAENGLEDHTRFADDAMTTANADEFEQEKKERDDRAALDIEIEDAAEEFEAALATGEDTQVLGEHLAKLERQRDEAQGPVQEIEPEAEQATDPALALAEAELGLEAIFTTAKDAGMTEAQYSTYLVAVAQRREAAAKRLENARLKQQQRENTAAFKAEVENQAARIRERLIQTPAEDGSNVYAAITNLQQERLDQEATKAALPEKATLDDLPLNGTRRVVAAKDETNTVDPGLWADLHGFSSAEDMIADMVTAPRFDARVAREALEAAREKRPDLTDEAQELEAAIEALHTDEHAQVLLDELNALREAKGEGRMKKRGIIAKARKAIGKLKLLELRPSRFFSQERRHARQAGILLRAGKRAEAAVAKFKQLLNFQQAILAFEIRQIVKKRVKFLQKAMKPLTKTSTLPFAYHEAIGLLLEPYLLGAKLSEKKRAALAEFVETQKQKGIFVDIDQRVIDDAEKLSIQELTLDEFNALYETVRRLHELGIQKNKFADEQRKAAVQEVATELAFTAKANLDKGSSQAREFNTHWERFKQGTKDAFSLYLNIGTITGWIDGFTPLGAAVRNLQLPIFRAMTEGYRAAQVGFLRRQRDEAKRLLTLFNRHLKTKKERLDFFSKKVNIPGVGRRTRNWYITVLLQLGNESSRAALTAALLKGERQVTDAEIDAIVAFASKEDFEFVQAIWDHLDSFWEEISAAHLRRYNLKPEKVVSVPLETQHGTFKGGYYFLRYDGNHSIAESQSSSDSVDVLSDLMKGVAVGSHTNDGHTKTRQAASGRTIVLDIARMATHIETVIYDLEVGDAAVDTYKLIHHPTFKAAMEEQGFVTLWKALSLQMADVVSGDHKLGGTVEAFARWLRAGITIQALGLSIPTAIMQPLGIVNTAVQIGTAHTLWAVQYVSFNPETYALAASMSGFMETRVQNYQRDISDAQAMMKSAIFERFTPGNSAPYMRASVFWMITIMQRWADTVTWFAAKRRGIEQGMSEKDSITFADLMVSRTQGTGIMSERSALERGTIHPRVRQSELIKLFTPFVTYFMAKTNIMAEKMIKAGHQGGIRSPAAVSIVMLNVLMLYTLEAAAVSLIRGEFPDQDDPDADSLPLHLLKETVNQMMAGAPIIREVAGSVRGFGGTGGVFAAFANNTGKAWNQLSQLEFDNAMFKAVGTWLGQIFHAPTGQPIRTLGTALRANEGYDTDLRDWIFGFDEKRHGLR